MQQHCAIRFDVGGALRNMTFTCTNKLCKTTARVCSHWSRGMFVYSHPAETNVHNRQGFTLILLFSLSHICLLSLLSSVNCVCQFTKYYLCFCLFYIMVSINSSRTQNCIKNKVWLCRVISQPLLLPAAITNPEMTKVTTYQHFQMLVTMSKAIF